MSPSIDPVPKWSENSLPAAPNIRVLTTSRQVLGIEDEKILSVPLLDVADVEGFDDAIDLDAVVLFADRAAVVSRDFSVDTRNWAQVVRVCRRLDRVPLAIELAAVAADLGSRRTVGSA
jgi:predicted ATPase